MSNCKYCYYNTVLHACTDHPREECEEYEYNHLAEKYENKRFQLRWESHPINDQLIMSDNLNEFPDWSFERLEDGEELADFLNNKEQEIQDIEDLYVNSVLSLIEKYIKLNNSKEGVLIGKAYAERLTALFEVMEETGNEEYIYDFTI